MHTTTMPSIAAPVLRDRERAIVTFASWQMFALIYLQKFAVGTATFQLDVPMLIMFAGIGRMLVWRNLMFSLPRLAIYLLFVMLCLLSQSLRGGSLPSLMQLVLLYASTTVCGTVPGAAYRRVLDRFIAFMLLPSWIVIVQYVYQRITGGGDPISMTPYFPKSLLMQGYFYEAHSPWYAPFMRPNGLFFLEPSFASAFAASAVILEIIYFRRISRIVLLLAAVFMSTGATGVSMLIIAAPFLVARESPRVIAMVTICGVVVIISAVALDIPLPLMSRASELDSANSSGGGRVTLPAERFMALVSDPSYIFIGDGGGASTPPSWMKGGNSPLMSTWPTVKLVNEYGLLSMLAFLTLFMTGMLGRVNLPLKAALSTAFLFSGGYLLNPVMVELLALFCFIISPAEQDQDA